MNILVDSSVILRYVAVDDPLHPRVLSKVEGLLSGGHLVVFTPQVARECWSVMTRPKEVNGLGLSPQEAAVLMVPVESIFSFFDDKPGIFAEWNRLVRESGVSGKQAHDANHVAAMAVHGLDTILTLDERDFLRYPEVSVLKP